MRYGIFFLLLASVIWCHSAASADNDRRCAVCNDRLKKRFLQGSDNKFYCSEKCFESLLPKCADCGKPCHGKYLTVENKTYCARGCADKQIRCRRCFVPFDQGISVVTPYGKFIYCQQCSRYQECMICERREKRMRQVSNGYFLCYLCDKDGINNPQVFQQVFRDVRRFLAAKFNFPDNHTIRLEMRKSLKNPEEPNFNSKELGLYVYSGKIHIIQKKNGKKSLKFTDEVCRILILESMPKFKLAEVLAHELAHDYMKHRWHFIKDLKLQEGFAELIASEYNRMNGQGVWNYRMQYNKDPVYGGGYRLLRSWLQKGSWTEVVRQLDDANRRAMPMQLLK